MADVVRAALVQTAWTGDKSSMIDLHEHHARAAASQGAQVICFQELFYGPYFCQVQDATYYDYAEAVPEGETTQRFMALAAELNMVMILPVYEMEQEGVLYNTAAVIDALSPVHAVCTSAALTTSAMVPPFERTLLRPRIERTIDNVRRRRPRTRELSTGVDAYAIAF